MKTAETHRATVETCVYCPKLCRWACPVADAEARETVTPWGLMTLVDDVARGRARLDETTAEVLAHCTGCRRCQHVCKHDNPMPTALLAARAEAVEAGVAPAGWAAWADEPPPPSATLDALPAAGAVRLLAGYADDARIVASLALLDAAGYAPGRVVVDGETARTTGHRHLAAGRPAQQTAAAKRLAQALDGVEVVVCLDAEDAEALRFGGVERRAGAPRVMHLVEAVAGVTLAPAVDGDVVYLDACRLGRGLGLVEPPRALVRAVVRGVIHEAVTAGEDGSCCGAGGGLTAVAPDDAAAVARAMADEADAAPAEAPVVIAGRCAAHLRASLAPRVVWSWAELVARGLPAGDEPLEKR